MPESETTILELEAIIQRYTTYFLLFDIVFAIFLLGGVILLIHFANLELINFRPFCPFLLYIIRLNYIFKYKKKQYKLLFILRISNKL